MTDTRAGLVRFVQAGTVRLAYRTWGSAGAPPLVLLHALGEQSTDWAPVARAFESSWRGYAPDLRGHGASDWTGPYTIEQLTADLGAFLDALGLQQVALGGHSMGGPPAYLYAARHPARVTRLVLEDPAPPWPRPARVLARPEGPLPFDWEVTALSNEFTANPQLTAWREELRRIAAPALIIAGGPARSLIPNGPVVPASPGPPPDGCLRRSRWWVIFHPQGWKMTHAHGQPHRSRDNSKKRTASARLAVEGWYLSVIWVVMTTQITDKPKPGAYSAG